MIAILQSLVFASAGILVDSAAAPWNALDDVALRARAAVALTNAAVSVTEKRMVPEGGDRHDYMSFGPYWWPDPSKKDGLPFIRRDGDASPSQLRAGEFLLPYWRKEKPWPYKQIKNFRFDPDAYRVPLTIYNHMNERKTK